jgi:hypothetical protein
MPWIYHRGRVAVVVVLVILVGLGLVCLLTWFAVVLAGRYMNRTTGQATAVHALQASVAAALNSPTRPGGDAESALRANLDQVRDKQLRELASELLDRSRQLWAPADPVAEARIRGEMNVLQERFRDRSIDVVRSLDRSRFR